MPADNSHAERKIARRRALDRALAHAVARYDLYGGLRADAESRHLASVRLARDLDVGLNRAAELLADALARRAANKLGE